MGLLLSLSSIVPAAISSLTFPLSPVPTCWEVATSSSDLANYLKDRMFCGPVIPKNLLLDGDCLDAWSRITPIADVPLDLGNSLPPLPFHKKIQIETACFVYLKGKIEFLLFNFSDHEVCWIIQKGEQSPLMIVLIINWMGKWSLGRCRKWDCLFEFCAYRISRAKRALR